MDAEADLPRCWLHISLLSSPSAVTVLLYSVCGLFKTLFTSLPSAATVAGGLQVCNALHHLPHCIKYMQGLRDRDVFRFCAIPQIMAIGTLALCYNNGAIFEGE
jgi:hypothetical protein